MPEKIRPQTCSRVKKRTSTEAKPERFDSRRDYLVGVRVDEKLEFMAQLAANTELSLNMRDEGMKSSQRRLQNSSARAWSVLNSCKSENSLDENENMAMLELEEYEAREESQRRYVSSKEDNHKERGPTSLTKKLSLEDELQLIGDLSKPCALPCLLTSTRDYDLKTISGNTLARLIQGEFLDQLGTGGGYQIIDCRYPYEFVGGHIQGARNLYTRGQIQEAFPSLTHKEEDGRRIYVFHCEFSSQRGPRLLRFLRNRDRREHAASYPILDYPELYLLHRGYKEFHGSHGHLCEPSEYVPMLSTAYKEELRYFRAKTKSRTKSKCGDGEGEGDGSIRTRSLRKPRSLPFSF